MFDIPGHDRWLDPPDPPTHGNCKGCSELFDFDDMNQRGDYYYCEDCVEEYDKENADE